MRVIAVFAGKDVVVIVVVSSLAPLFVIYP